jgi:SAM-dependent methyltransferase
MAFKARIRRFIAAIGRIPAISTIIQQPSVRTQIEKIPKADLLYGNGWERIHPFDLLHRTDTSGVAPAKDISDQEAIITHAVDYAGSQLSVLRLALNDLLPLDDYTFIDLGCGKGRALLVASEFPFRAILGVELSSRLAEIARRNAEIVATQFPTRTPVRVAVGDASTFPLPAGNLVIFLYNPFGAKLIANVVAGVEAALAAAARNIYIIYYNPVAGNCFDASPLLHRCFAQMLPYAIDELGYGPDRDDPLIIWQGGCVNTTKPGSVDAKILVSSDGMRATLVPS